jgi:hypothetical protein
LSHKTKTRRLGGQRWDPGVPRSFDVGDTWQDGRACVGRMRTAAKAWPCVEDEYDMTYLPLRSLYLKFKC